MPTGIYQRRFIKAKFIKCYVCKKKIYLMPSLIHRHNFCSRKCWSKYFGKTIGGWNKGKHSSMLTRWKISIGHKGQKAWNKGITSKKEIICPICKSIFLIIPSAIKIRKTCSKRCMGLSNRNKNHPNWKGGVKRTYGIYARALFYENNTNIVCELCGNLENIHIHHKDLNYKNNNLENLQSLCKSCHSKLHRKIDKTNGKIFFKKGGI